MSSNPDVVSLIEPWTSGSRLRATLRVGDNGAAVFAHWHDTTLDIDCQFVPTASGYRCLPRTRGQTAHTNDTCTDAGAVSLTQGCTDSNAGWVAVEPRRNACPTEWSAAEVVGSGWNLGVYRGSPGSCTPKETSPEDDRDVEPADLATFAVGIASLAVVDGVGVRQLSTIGGASQRFALTDMRGDACDEGYLLVEGRCVPGRIRSATHFADAACSTPAATGLPCETVRYATLADSDAVYEVKDPTDVVYEMTESGCHHVADTDEVAYPLGKSVDREAFPTLTRAAVDEGSFVPRWWQHDGQPLLWDASAWLIDGRSCGIRTFTRGEACLSNGLDAISHAPIVGPYADPDCAIETERLGSSTRSIGFVAERNDECRGEYLSPHAVREHEGPVFERDAAGDCVEVERDPNDTLVVHTDDRSEIEWFERVVE